MFGLLTRKQAEKEFCKIAQGFKDIKQDITSRSEIELMIENKILKLREVSSQTLQTPIRKKVNRLLNKAEIMQEIALNEEKGLSTMEMYDIVVSEKKMCKKSCFFKHLKIVRNKNLQTTQTKITN